MLTILLLYEDLFFSFSLFPSRILKREIPLYFGRILVFFFSLWIYGLGFIMLYLVAFSKSTSPWFIHSFLTFPGSNGDWNPCRSRRDVSRFLRTDPVYFVSNFPKAFFETKKNVWKVRGEENRVRSDNCRFFLHFLSFYTSEKLVWMCD